MYHEQLSRSLLKQMELVEILKVIETEILNNHKNLSFDSPPVLKSELDIIFRAGFPVPEFSSNPWGREQTYRLYEFLDELNTIADAQMYDYPRVHDSGCTTARIIIKLRK